MVLRAIFHLAIYCRIKANIVAFFRSLVFGMSFVPVYSIWSFKIKEYASNYDWQVLGQNRFYVFLNILMTVCKGLFQIKTIFQKNGQ